MNNNKSFLAAFFIIIGFVFLVLSFTPTPERHGYNWLSRIFFILWCWFYAKSKGRSPFWGLLWILTIWWVFVIFFLKNHNQANTYISKLKKDIDIIDVRNDFALKYLFKKWVIVIPFINNDMNFHLRFFSELNNHEDYYLLNRNWDKQININALEKRLEKMYKKYFQKKSQI